MIEPLLSGASVRKILNTSPSTLARWTQSGELASYKIGGQVKYRQSDIEAFIERRRRGIVLKDELELQAARQHEMDQLIAKLKVVSVMTDSEIQSMRNAREAKAAQTAVEAGGVK